MFPVNTILPKVHIIFNSEDNKETVRELLIDDLSQLLEWYINTYLTTIGQVKLSASVINNQGKVYEKNNKWIVGVKVVVSGDTTLTEKDFDNFWVPIKEYIKDRISIRFIEVGISFTDLRFHFKTPGSDYGVEET